MKHLVNRVVLVISFCLISILVPGQVNRYKRNTIKLDKTEYEYYTDSCHKSCIVDLYRLDFQEQCNIDINYSLFLEDNRPRPYKNTYKTYENGEWKEISEEIEEDPIGWEQFRIRFRPIMTYNLKRQIQKCFTREDIINLCWNWRTVKLKLYPRVSDKGRIVGFHYIRIDSGDMIIEELLGMKFMDRVINLLEKKLYIDSNGKMERYNVKFYNASQPVNVTINYYGGVELGFGEPEWL